MWIYQYMHNYDTVLSARWNIPCTSPIHLSRAFSRVKYLRPVPWIMNLARETIPCAFFGTICKYVWLISMGRVPVWVLIMDDFLYSVWMYNMCIICECQSGYICSLCAIWWELVDYCYLYMLLYKKNNCLYNFISYWGIFNVFII